VRGRNDLTVTDRSKEQSVYRKLLVLSLLTAACSSATTTNSTEPSPMPPTSSAMPLVPGAVWPGEGPMKWSPRPTTPAITANDLRTRLYQISDDSMMGRQIGSEGNFKTTDYVASEFKRLGLRPAGDNGTYFQILDYGTSSFDESASRLSVGATALRAESDWAPLTGSPASGTGMSASLNNVPTVFAGAWNDTTVALGNMSGKVAVFTMSGGTQRAANGRVMTPNYAAIGGARAMRAGAAGILVVLDTDMLPRAVVTAAFNGRNGMKPASVGSASGIPIAVATEAAGARIFGKPLSQMSVGATGQPITASWNYGFKRSQYPARNVVAILPGSDPVRANEYVLVGAHNDHVGTLPVGLDHDSLRSFNTVMRPQGANDCRNPCVPTADQQRQIDALIANARKIRAPRRDSIMNGADDDGSGTVVLLEIAEKFALEHPARSIIFISHQGEEAGLLGSKWFVDHPTVPLSNIVAAHNMDMVGKGHVYDVKFGGPNSVQTLGARRLSREFGDIIDSVNAIIQNPMALDKSWDVPANPLNRFCRSDQVNYVHADIPVTYFSFGYARDYHQATDEPQYIDYDHSARLGNFLHDVMTAIANRRDKPAIAGPDPAYPLCR
jgi:hypothetical protein